MEISPPPPPPTSASKLKHHCSSFWSPFSFSFFPLAVVQKNSIFSQEKNSTFFALISCFVLAEPENPPAGRLQYMPPPPPPPPSSITIGSNNGSGTTSSSGGSSSGGSTSLFASLFASASATTAAQATTFSDLIGAMSRTDRSLATEAPSLCLSTSGPASLYSQPPQELHPFLPPPPLPPPSPHMSATALLQKAAQMGATATSSSSFLRGFGFSTSTAGHPDGLHDGGFNWRPQQQQLEPEPTPILSSGLGLGLPYDTAAAAAAAGLPDLMMGPPPLFGPKPATLDFLGLGMGPVGGAATGGLSALITSIGGGLDMGSGTAAAASAGRFGGGSSPGKAWEGAERKPNSPAIL